MKPLTHAYAEGDEKEDNFHEHGMTSAQLAAMFAKNRQAGPGKSGIAKPGRLAHPGQKGERANLMQVVRSKPHTPDQARKTKPSKSGVKVPSKPAATKAPVTVKARIPSSHAPAAKPKIHSSHAKPHKKGGHHPGHAGHSPIGVMKHLKHQAQHVAHKAIEGVVLASGQEPTVGGLKASVAGHHGLEQVKGIETVVEGKISGHGPGCRCWRCWRDGDR